MSELLKKSFINSNELETLLKERKEGKANFILVDVREQIEYDMSHIKGVDMLKPTSLFQSWGEAFLNDNRDKTVIFTCRTDYRSGNVQRVFQQNGMENVINHSGGIVSYRGEIVQG
ncbi:Rubredoxin [hydrothermal vent metagenome]|uniref:Rubredoxin n=1 Tax=hydrothermal vent metagenome TaxID=652676 RepID=A0A1W1D1W0_9ZZZZ